VANTSISADVQKRIAEVLGWEAYNRLVDSVPNTRQRGRLRFWQEELIRQASLSGIVISTPEEFIRVFEGASPVPVPSQPWTREVFLSRIEAQPHGGFSFDETPVEWMAAAWEIERVRSTVSEDMARTVSKTGELAYTQEYLRYLSQALSISRQVELFLSIRDSGNQLREVEFRPGFERAFPDCVVHLPPQLTTAELADLLGISVQEYESQFLNPNHFPPPTVNDEQEDIPF
jgi:hypothetical protein